MSVLDKFLSIMKLDDEDDFEDDFFDEDDEFEENSLDDLEFPGDIEDDESMEGDE